jgi:hypothetical protein
MPKSALLESLSGAVNITAFKRGLKRLQALSDRQFESGLTVIELQELLAIRQELRAHMAAWLEKR